MKTFNEIIPLLLEELKIQISEKSYKTYKSQNNRFNEYLKSIGGDTLPISEITNEMVGRFFLHLASEHHLDKPTCQKYFISVRRVWQYANKHGYTDKMPFSTVIFPKKGKDMSSEVIPPEHSRIILEEIEQKDPQLYLACLTEYYCFIRPGKELRLMRVKDIDFVNGIIKVPQERAKNGHARMVTMPNQLLELYKKQNIDLYDKELYVFGKRKKPDSKPCSVNMLRYRFNKYRDKNGFSKGYHLYSWKHVGASVLHDSRLVSMRELMEQLGHSKLSATEHYIKKIGTGINTTIRQSFPTPY